MWPFRKTRRGKGKDRWAIGRALHAFWKLVDDIDMCPCSRCQYQPSGKTAGFRSAKKKNSITF